MAITILTPKPTPQIFGHTSSRDAVDTDSDSDSSSGGVDLEGDVSMQTSTAKARRRHTDDEPDIVAPGELITDDPQWMRGHGTYVTPDSLEIRSSVAGVVTRTNKLLSVRPLRARYTPEIGDLVVGRIVEVQAKRWRVDVGSSQLAILQISAINLPGGILRKRTDTDELQIRSFFAEGDLLVAEVQQLHNDGAASLHTRSLKYGKLRNGAFISLTGVGGGGGVVRSKRQAWTLEAANGASSIDVLLGVNGYIWVSKHVEGEGAAAATATSDSVGLNSMEDVVSQNMYSSQNDPIDVPTMREMARVRSVIVTLVEHGLRVDEEMVTRGYHEAVEMARASGEDIFLGGESGGVLAALLRKS